MGRVEWEWHDFCGVRGVMKNFAIVTGASSGIGLAYAKALAEEGYHLLMVSNEPAIHDRADELQTQYPELRVIGHEQDLGTPTAARELYDYCHAEGLDVEVLVNNAGVYHDRDIIDDSEGFTQLILQLHVTTPAMLCYYFAKDMVARTPEKGRKRGYILNMCSVTSHMAAQRLGTYGGTKAFLAHYTRALHIELRAKGVNVLEVSPGAVDTGLYNINGTITRIGRAVGFIVSPDYLARRALRCLWRGRSKVVIPTIWGNMLSLVVRILPTGLLRVIRRWGLF